MSTKTHSAEADIRDTASKVSEKARDIARDTAQSASDVADTVTRDVQDGIERANQKAREITQNQPLVALGGALLIGVAIGLALNSRR